jgi:hypothetical protein
MADPGSIKAGIELASLLLKEADKQGLFSKLKTIFKRKPRVLVLGCTGAGKTNFLEALVAQQPGAIRKEDRTRYTEAKDLLIQAGSPYRFIDTPGDTERKDDRIQAIREAMSAKGGISGVINVVSYGYHEYDLPVAQAVTGGVARPDFLDLHRKEEINQLSEWTDLLGDKQTVQWCVTVVTKADLWWDQKAAVLDHYRKGDYYKGLGSAKSLGPRVVPFSSVFHRFYGEARMSGVFDKTDQDTTRADLIKTLVAALLTQQGAK